MIWIWIILGILISSIYFFRQKIDPIHFIWVLFIVDCYGFHIAGTTIKPYMLFAFYLLYRSKGEVLITKERVWLLCLIGSAFFISDLANGIIVASILQHIYFIIILVEAIIYSNLIKEQDLHNIISSVLFSVMGYGIVCIFAMITYYAGMKLPGIVSDTEAIGAMIRKYSTMDGATYVETYRLHGFENDPNSFNMPFLFGLTASLYNIYMQKNTKKLNILVFLISILCIFFSGSRAAMYISGLLLIITTISVISANKNSKVMLIIIVLAYLFSVIILSIDENTLKSIVSTIYLQPGRADLTSKYGRFSIWKENFGCLLNNNPIFGLGANQVMFYSSISRSCHNTWLEWLCSIGLIQGLLMDLWFFSGLTNAMSYKNSVLNSEEKNGITVLQIAYLAYLLMLSTIDYIANTYLLFTFILIKALCSSTVSNIQTKHNQKYEVSSKKYKYII